MKQYKKLAVIFTMSVAVIHGPARSAESAQSSAKSSVSATYDLSVLIKKMDHQYQELLAIKGALENQTFELAQLKNKIGSTAQAPTTRELHEQLSEKKPLRPSILVPSNQLSADDAYEKAYKFMKKKQHAKAITAFREFAEHYPKSKLVPNAHYWLGELLLSMRQFDEADKSFTLVIDQYTRSNKVAGSRLKKAYILMHHEKNADANQALRQIIRDYPDSSVAVLAENKLAELLATADTTKPTNTNET